MPLLIPNDDSVSPNQIQPGADLSGADLSGANVLGGNLSETILRDANMSQTELSFVNLSKANLRDTDFSEAKLRGTDLFYVLMRDTVLDGITISRGTNIKSPEKQIKQSFAGADILKERQYNVIARANHDLREAFSENGLLSQARTARVRERRARRKGAKAESGLQGIWTGFSLAYRACSPGTGFSLDQSLYGC